MILAVAMIVLLLTVYMFVRDMGNQQVISSQFNSFYRPFRAETVVLHEYISKPDMIWKTLTALEDYCLWFPGVNRILPIVDSSRYVHRFSFDRFSFEPGAFIKIRPKSFLPWFNGRIVGVETNKKLELEMRFSPINKETVSFEINLTPSGSSEVVCTRNSHGFFSFLTMWGFADRGSKILHNLGYFIPEYKSAVKENGGEAAKDVGPQLSRETIIAQGVQAGIDGNMDLINAIPDKPTRGMAKAALVKAKRVGKMPDNLIEALKAGPIASTPDSVPVGGLPLFNNNEDLIAYVVNKALDGDMDPINSIPDKPLRGKAKAAMVKAKRTGEKPPMPNVPDGPPSASASSSLPEGEEPEEALMARLVEAGIKGNMDEINALENRVLRGKIKAAIVRAKRAAK
ncbi:MAG: hypothetical protein QF847_04750 [Candidatus Marinimicrobia bacterium]|jgi:hypothetical protein|nr:hypothetical protein [Candidatus Neomarinimicrobiota bacterium]|tara:strand:- start:25995 stop:27191 length:1197 start_codon:yes stop_codon:yes gene_type:complete